MFNMKEGIGAILLIVGIYACIRSFLGREFYLAGIGGSGPSKPLPNWIARPFAFLLGIGAVMLGWGLLRS